MKANKLFFLAITSFISIQSLSPDLILKANLRSPASDEKVEETKEEKKEETKPEKTICKSELKGEKLEADVKKSLSDKEEVISKLEAKTESKVESKDEVKKSDNSEILALMSQMTTMFTLQMQMQMQMMNMFSLMQFNQQPMAYPTLSDSLNFYGMGVGIPAQTSPWSNYSNPYSIMPSISQQPEQSTFGYGYGFDFNQNQNSALPQLSRQQIPGAANLGYDFSQERTPAQQPLPAVDTILPTLQRL